MSAGLNRLEWRYLKDANFSSGNDAAYLDNVYLPKNTPDTANPVAWLRLYQMPDDGALIELQGQAGRTYVVEASDDLLSWAPLSTNVLTGNLIFVPDQNATNRPLRFYRAVAR